MAPSISVQLCKTVRAFPSLPGVLCALAGLCASAAAASADVAVDRQRAFLPAPGTLALKAGSVRVDGLVDALVEDAALGERAYVIVTDRALTAAQQQALADAGAAVFAFLPAQAYVADLRGTTTAALRGLGFVTSIHAWDDAWKLDPMLAGPLTGQWSTPERQAIARAGEVLINVQLFPNENAAAFAQRLVQRAPAAQLMDSDLVGGQLTFCVKVPADAVPSVAGLAEVFFIEPAGEIMLRSNASTRWLLTSGVAGVESVHDAGITGVGQVVGMLDSRPDWNHCAFVDSVPFGPEHRKIIAYNATQTTPALHGTHTSCIAVGNGFEGPGGPPAPPFASTDDLRGMAYGAKMVYNFYPPLGEANIYARFELHRAQGAFVHSNSWGTDATRQYDATCRAVDNFMHTNEDQLILHSVSNSTIVTNPENAKNSIGVGASRNAPDENSFCQGGNAPTLDGRQKPDIVVPGCAVVSATPNIAAPSCNTVANTGTSMACPAAAGVATLARQYFTEGWYPSGSPTPSNAFVPSGALLKAVVLNSTQDLTDIAGFPSTREGWGRPLLESVLYFAGRTPAETRRLVAIDTRNTSSRALTTGTSRTYRVNVVSTGEPLRVTMAYTDAPATLPTSFAPVNNLDMQVRAPNGDVYLGNAFVDGASALGGMPDALNNLEQVLVPAPQLGVWEVTIVGTAVNLGTQGFAIAASGALVHVTCNDIDFNNDGSVYDPADIVAFLSVYGEGPCVPETQACDSIDFNNDGSLFDPMDLDAFLRVYSEGPCE